MTYTNFQDVFFFFFGFQPNEMKMNECNCCESPIHPLLYAIK